MASPIPHAITQFTDKQGNALGNGTVAFYEPGTLTPRPTWSDPDLTTLNSNPVQLDNNGRAAIYGTGRYRQLVRAANSTIITDGVTTLESEGLPLATELAALSIDAATRTIQTCGFSTPGRGAAHYARLDTPPSAIEQLAGLNRWLFRTNSNSVWWKLADPHPTDLMFGVQATAKVTASNGVMTITGPDDTAAIQAAIDYTIYFSDGNSRRLHLPSGQRRITSTLQLGYGMTFVDWQIEGDGARGWDANAGYHSGIYADFNDCPAINIQGARSVRLSSLGIYGYNHAWLAYTGLTTADRTHLANWWGSQLRPTSVNTRYAPYCGVAIDAYSGTRQAASSYPDVSYPAWLGTMTQYGKNTSGVVEFRDVAVGGFEVGFAVQPNQMPVASNGEFIHWVGCDLNLNVVGASISHSDARAITFERCRFQGCYTGFDSLTYGSRQGNIAAVFSSCTFDRSYRMLNVDLGISAQPFASTATFVNAYAEGLYTIGVVRTSTATGRPGAIIFQGGELGFSLRSGEYTPATYLEGLGHVRATFDDVSLIGTMGVFPVNCDVARFAVTLPAVNQLVFDQSTAAGRRAANALCGIDAPRIESASVRPFCIYANSGTAFFNQRCRSHGWDFTASGQASNGVSVPLFVRSVDFAGQASPIADAPQEVLNRATYPLTLVANTGIEWTVSVNGGFLSDPDNPACCIGAGDIVRDEQTGQLFYVKSMTSAGTGASLVLTIVLRLITNVRSTDGINWSTQATVALDSGVLRFRNGRRVLAGARRRLAMNTTAGSGSVNLVAVGPETFAGTDLGTTVWTLAVGDYVVPTDKGAGSLEDSVFAKGRITAISQSGGAPTGQLTLDSTARRTGLWHAPLFIKGT